MPVGKVDRLVDKKPRRGGAGLSLVATPIGNLEDITLRAIRTLKEADFVIAEDTRHSGLLLKKYEIRTPMLSFHGHSTENQLAHILDLLKAGKQCALITDAGTPGISDPGFLLIREALAHGIPVTSIPGPSAVTTAVIASGLPCHRFLYLGFLPIKKGRKRLIASLSDVPYTVVLYEAPHRLQRTLSELRTALGNRRVAVCREMTKMYEEFFRGTLDEALAYFSAKTPKGEFTLVVDANNE